MSISALIMLLITQIIVSGFTSYFFWRVLSIKKTNIKIDSKCDVTNNENEKK